MTAAILTTHERREIEADGSTILEAAQKLKLDLPAPCGGNGTCGKCQVLIHDGDGLHYELACQTAVADGMEIHLEAQQEMVIQTAGKVRLYEVDEPRAGYGIAMDIGTTTLVCRLHDMQTGALLGSISKVNPQVIYGSDVIARITASMEGHLDDLCDLLRSVLDGMVEALCRKARIDRSDIIDMTLAGNTVIEHLAARLSPDTIGVSPYKPLSRFGDYMPFEPVREAAYFAPAVSGYVGGDITAGILASGIHEAQSLQVFLDLGTNGELAIGCKDWIVCCATAAGPVFEGAMIHFGMAARQGAISSVSRDGDALALSVIGDVEPVGICGTGLIEAVAFLVEAGLVDEGGRLLDREEAAGPFAARLDTCEDKKVFFLDEKRSVFLCQADIRNVQLAKAAICAGILTLLDAKGLSGADIESMIIAGGFGSYLNIEAAARIGLFPTELFDRAKSIGNTAAEGASMLLLSSRAREMTEHIADACGYIELSTCAQFNRFYMECMAFDDMPL